MPPAFKRLLPGLLAGLLTVAMVGTATWLQREGTPDGQTSSALTPAEVDTWVQLWNSGTAGRRQVDEHLPSSEARLLVVRALLETTRAPDMEICRLLHESGPKQWCRSTLGRPHLYETNQPAAAIRTRPGGGPIDTQLVASRALMDLEPSGPPPECSDHSDLRICAAQTAISAGLRSDPAAVREACLHIEAGRWRDECVFMAAERMHQAYGEASLAQTTWLCAHAGEFNHHCLKRIIEKLASSAPAADISHGWERVLDRAGMLQLGLGETDPILAQQVVDWYYAESLDQAYAKTRVVQGAPLAWLPEAVHPHVRAAAIERLVHASANTDMPLSEWIQLIEHAMQSASPPPPPMAPAPVHSHPPSNLWGVEAPGEADLPAVYWRGSARRLTTKDPASDRLICLMESLARNIRPASHELGSLVNHPDAAVRLTASRLAEAVAHRRE